MRTAALTALRDFLTAQPPGVLPADAAACTIALLRTCWDAIEGSEAERTDIRHLSRAEDVAWELADVPERVPMLSEDEEPAATIGELAELGLAQTLLECVQLRVVSELPDAGGLRPTSSWSAAVSARS